jgi:hypothetical protein
MLELATALIAGWLCGLMGGAVTTLSAWSLVDAWRWRRVRRSRLVPAGLVGLGGGLAMVVLAGMAWAAVFL